MLVAANAELPQFYGINYSHYGILAENVNNMVNYKCPTFILDIDW